MERLHPAAAIIAAAGGVSVAKHGNRSRTGRGSAEALQALGVNVDADPKIQARCLEEAGICFCFAIHHHPATRHVMPVRKALGVPTIFNLLGPLTNPAGAGRQMMGIYDGEFLDVIGEAFVDLGTRHAMVLHSEDGLDECSISAPTTIVHVVEGEVHRQTITPEDVGLERAPIESVTARDLEHATKMVREVLDGTMDGPPLDMALLNAGAALHVGGGCGSLVDGVELAGETVASGRAMETLQRLAEPQPPVDTGLDMNIGYSKTTVSWTGPFSPSSNLMVRTRPSTTMSISADGASPWRWTDRC